MKQRPFGSTGLTVSEVGFGAGHIGDGSMSEDEVGHLLNALVDEGVTLFDTARSYGLSEERIGRHLAHRRGEIVLSTKIGYGIDGYEDWTPEIIEPAVDRALGMLRTDVLDIVHFHSCPLDVLQRGDVTAALQRCVEKGKVRVAAYSGDNEAFDFAVRELAAVQTSINIVDQRAAEFLGSLGVPRSSSGGTATPPRNSEEPEEPRGTALAVIAKRPLANAPWRFAERPHGHDAEEYWLRWKTIEHEIDRGGMSWDELALRFTLGVPGVHSAIVGSRNLDNMRANIAIASKGPLPEEIHRSVRQSFRTEWPGKI
ncbi:MAG TPA: aldo/keto reductase [Thermoanaerobaculia bacterium]